MKTKAEAAANPRPGDRWESSVIFLTLTKITGKYLYFTREWKFIDAPSEKGQKMLRKALPLFAGYARYIGGRDEN